MTLHLEDLPLHVRARLSDQLDEYVAKAPRQRQRRTVGGASPYRCGVCALELPSYPAAERHLDAEHDGHGRLNLILPT